MTYQAFESQYYIQSCLEVSDAEAALFGTASQTGRRLKGASKAGAAGGAAASGEDSGSSDGSWTKLGVTKSSGLEPLGVTSFTGVCLILAGFAGWAMLRSVYDNMEEEGVNDGMRKKLDSSKTLNKLTRQGALKNFVLPDLSCNKKSDQAEQAEGAGAGAGAGAGPGAGADPTLKALLAEMQNFNSQIGKRMAMLEDRGSPLGSNRFVPVRVSPIARGTDIVSPPSSSRSSHGGAVVVGGARDRRLNAPARRRSPERQVALEEMSSELPLKKPSEFQLGELKPSPRELELELETTSRRRRSNPERKASTDVGMRSAGHSDLVI